MRPAEPLLSGRAAPTGTIVRSSLGDSSERDADPALALAYEQLDALSGGIAQPLERGTGQRGQRKGRLGPVAEGDEPQSEAETAAGVAPDQPVRFEGHGQAVRGGPRETGGRNEVGERQRTRLERGQDRRGLVDDAHTAYRVSHKSNNVSQIARHFMATTLPQKYGTGTWSTQTPTATCSTSTSISSTR